jgi:hypothetical protein
MSAEGLLMALPRRKSFVRLSGEELTFIERLEGEGLTRSGHFRIRSPVRHYTP